LLVRNPWGITNYSDKWNKNYGSWDSATKAVVANAFNNIDPTVDYAKGYFVVPTNRMQNAACFSDYQIAHVRDDMKSTWYDAELMDEKLTTFYVSPKEKRGDLYFTVESYPINTIPEECTTGEFSYLQGFTRIVQEATLPLLFIKVYKNPWFLGEEVIGEIYYLEQF
jgi:hypothetical protein